MGDDERVAAALLKDADVLTLCELVVCRGERHHFIRPIMLLEKLDDDDEDKPAMAEPTEVTPDDLGRRRPADFAVEPGVSPLDHFKNVQLAGEQRLD